MNVLSLSRRGRCCVAAAWLLAALVALPLAGEVNQKLEAAARLDGSESGQVVDALRAGFRSPYAEVALLRLVGAPSPAGAEGRALLARVVQAIRAVHGVAGVLSYLQADDRIFIGTDGSPILLVGLDARQISPDAAIPRLTAAGEVFRLQSLQSYPALAFRWTGEAAINADIRREGSSQTDRAELLAFPITLVLLLVAFRSVVSAALPLVCGALTMIVTLGAAVVVNEFWPLSVILVSVVSMVGLGLSIDYALLIISRYREALAQGHDIRAAILAASKQGGHTVMVSGTSVAIGFAAMLMVSVNEVRSIGVGGLLVTVVSVLVAVTLLPLVLAWLGPRIEAGRIGGNPKPHGTRHWRRWAAVVDRYPAVVLVISAIPLVLLAAQAPRLHTDLPHGAWLPAHVPSVQVLTEFESIGRSNLGETLRVIVDLPAGTTMDDQTGWTAVANIAARLSRDERIDRVWAATEFVVRDALPTMSPEVRRGLISSDGRHALVELLPREGLGSREATALVREIRAANAASWSRLAGTRMRVGGVPAFNADYSDAMSNALGIVVVSVIGATLLILALAFRSLLIPLKAIALNLLSVTASFGAVVLVFQDGYGSRLFGLAHPLDGGFPILPVLVFCAVFGLSMDYEVFLVARVAEGHRAGLTDTNALAEALASTGRVITLAASIMVAIFGAFVLGDFVLIKILGFALGVAVLLDATLVRLALGPALLRLAGRFNWWPGDGVRKAAKVSP